MPTTKVYNLQAVEVGTMKLNDSVFAAEYNEPLIHQAIVTYLNNQRQGTKANLSRAEVKGRAKKPWRQKGTGRARQGSRRSPQWTKGGVAFALKPRDFSQKINKTAKRAAFVSALSAKLKQKDVFVVENFDLADHKTKNAQAILDAFKFGKSVLMITNEPNENLMKATNNISRVNVANCSLVNVYQIVNADKILASKAAIKSIEEAYADGSE